MAALKYAASLIYCPLRFRRASISLWSLLFLSTMLAGCQLLGKSTPYDTEPPYIKNPCLVLALPASGQYANISARIKQGAELARQKLNASGTNVHIQNINTDAADWLAKLQALPPQCTVVGGPLRDNNYLEARRAGLTDQRAFFVFTPTLQQGDEGKSAWRFFPSPQDQIESLLSFVTDDLNIHTYASLSPADNYGKRMTNLLENSLQKRNIPLQKAIYASPTSPAIKSAVRSLLNPIPGENGKTQLPQTAFEALFLPDSWKRVDMVTTSLLANGEDRLVLLGTTLWEQGLSGKQIPEASRYALAIFPGTWYQPNAPEPLRKGNNDFWTALGYDFVNFGTAVALGERPSSAIVTARAQRAAGTIRGMAPLLWDANGVAHQRLYLFQIGPGGVQPLNPDAFRQKRSAIAERAALRMQGWGNINPDTGEALPKEHALPPEEITPVGAPEEPAIKPIAQPAMPRQVAPAQTQPATVSTPPASGAEGNAILNTVPHPSYKLSLPVKK